MKNIIILAFFIPLMLLAQANPFLPPTNTATAQDSSINKQKSQPKESTPSLSKRTPFLQEITKVQKDLHEKISSILQVLKKEFNIQHLGYLLIVAFFYGIIHSLGPGHAKLLIGSRLMVSHHQRIDAIKAGSIFAATHTGVAALLFMSINFILKTSRSNSDIVASNLLKVSGIMIMLTALFLFWQTISDIRRTSKKDEDTKNSNVSLYILAFFAGLSPCPGVLLILIFSNILGIPLYGFLAVIAVSLGMALTVSTIGVFAITTKNTVLHSTKKIQFIKIIVPIIRVLGAILILIIGYSFL